MRLEETINFYDEWLPLRTFLPQDSFGGNGPSAGAHCSCYAEAVLPNEYTFIMHDLSQRMTSLWFG